MANDNLSGVILTSLLLRFIKNIPNLKWTYRIIFLPETIGPIAYIKKNLDKIKKLIMELMFLVLEVEGKHVL